MPKRLEIPKILNGQRVLDSDMVNGRSRVEVECPGCLKPRWVDLASARYVGTKRCRGCSNRFSKSLISRVCTARGYVVWSWKKPDGRQINVPEHRIIMEQKLGRELLPGENVHHINGVRDDNRPENLELWVTSQPSGQRSEDLLEWADEIIRRYRTLEHT